MSGWKKTIVKRGLILAVILGALAGVGAWLELMPWQNRIGGNNLMRWNESAEKPNREADTVFARIVEQMERDGWELAYSQSTFLRDSPLFTLDDGSTRDWLFNSRTHEWERIEYVYDRIPVVDYPQTTMPGGSFGEAYCTVHMSELVESHVRLADQPYDMRINGHLAFRLVGVGLARLPGRSAGIKLDPKGISNEQADDDIEWASVPMVRKVFLRRQFIADPKGDKHDRPLGLDLRFGWEDHVTRDEPLVLRFNGLTYRSWLIVGDGSAAVFKRKLNRN